METATLYHGINPVLKKNYSYDKYNQLIGSDLSILSYNGIYDRTGITPKSHSDQRLSAHENTYFSWDTRERLTSFAPDKNSPNSNKTKYTYDYRGFRKSKVEPNRTTEFYYDKFGRLIGETLSYTNKSQSSLNEIVHIIHGHKPLARIINGSWYFYVYNSHGDVIRLVNDSGQTVNRYEYDEWGNTSKITEGVRNPLRYTAEYQDDESGLYYLRARYYEPKIGRFISEDTYEGDAKTR